MRYFEILTESQVDIREGLYPWGGEGIRYETDHGHIDINTKTQFSPRKQSVVDFVVDEDQRGKGIGKALLQQAMRNHDDIGAQVSSFASLKIFYDLGFRNPANPKGTLQEYEQTRKKDSSIFLAMRDREGNRY
jgi:GNAT superfamily N-acetyltransferase